MAKNENLRQVIDGIKFRYQLRTQKQICDALGYSSATYLSDLLSGKYPVTEEFSDKLKERFGVNPNFLLLDEGGIWIDGTGNITQIGDNNTQVTGNDNTITVPTTLDKALEEISEQRKLVAKSQEQIDRLLSIIEKMQRYDNNSGTAL